MNLRTLEPSGWTNFPLWDKNHFSTFAQTRRLRSSYQKWKGRAKRKTHSKTISPISCAVGRDRTFRPFLTAKGQHLTPKAMGKLSLLGTHWLNQRSLHVISMELRWTNAEKTFNWVLCPVGRGSFGMDSSRENICIKRDLEVLPLYCTILFSNACTHVSFYSSPCLCFHLFLTHIWIELLSKVWDHYTLLEIVFEGHNNTNDIG